MTNTQNKKFDLEERTAKFGEDVISFAKEIPTNNINESIVKQLIRAGTSVGANYCEADCAETRKDFEHKIAISKKEAKETKFWVRMIVKANPNVKENAEPLWREANELNLIFTAIIKKSKINSIKNGN